MSFDVFAQRMVNGELAVTDSDALRALIDPYVKSTEPESDFAQLQFDDGTADLYGIGEPGSGFMVNHVSGRLAWDLIAKVAATGDMTLMAPGVPPMIFDESVRAHLPEGLGDEAVVVASGADIVRMLDEA
ncbi:hypothetical protein H9657_02630 [Cellulomonas sp. Sa3CUA2]|uniref:SseB protein N-terminal domain-containing protein n=1 Tax=Cellulomonas avistercoris TaxID=2762242 RepID=A0ABR8Q9T6_9CELL|nr:hypothetical protein [Cellulomonas avistercoris]MBD7917174.1 hypothetical protein [Cellulomonas avistercoris]